MFLWPQMTSFPYVMCMPCSSCNLVSCMKRAVCMQTKQLWLKKSSLSCISCIRHRACAYVTRLTRGGDFVTLQITSVEHFDRVISHAAGADGKDPGGYEDSQGRWRQPHKLIVVAVYADWCRACLGLKPKILKLMAQHPEVLCLKLNKGEHEELAAKLGVRGLPTTILYRKGKRIDHFTTNDIDTIEEAVLDNT
ncbi:unnamed protein product [Choristocarpus tenellus]